MSPARLSSSCTVFRNSVKLHRFRGDRGHAAASPSARLGVIIHLHDRRSAATSVTLGLVQHRCVDGPGNQHAQGHPGYPRRGSPGRPDRLPPGAVPQPVLLPDRGSSALRARRTDSRALRPTPRTLAAGARRGDHRLALREARGRPVSQYRRHHRRRWASTSASTGRCTSRTIRSTTRNSTSRRETRASGAGTPASAGSACWYAGTSGTPRPPG